MDDLEYGTRNKRGDWAPNAKAQAAPLFVLPPRPIAFLKWLPHYFLPWNLLFAASAVAYWHFVVPDTVIMKTLAVSWILRLFVVNCVAVFLFYGAFELRLYILRRQQNRFKYNSKFPAEQRSEAFFFGRQNIDNLMRTFGTGLPIWTAIEVAILYAYAWGYAPWMTFTEHPWYLFAVGLAVPLIHSTHFYLLHRLLHWGPLYKWIHSVHHNSVNPSPWSSLSMHPVEQLGYFGEALWHLVIPSNPILALYQLHYTGFGAIVGHVGFNKIEVTENVLVDGDDYVHYLHHKYFEVNYGGGLIPFDQWFGTYHDGSKEAGARMQARYQKKKERLNKNSSKTI
ncbi:sterol desaturase family protein [Mesorhizobium sp. M0195]|uniref:sterol desaturase family protein n=1 Tax=Mesorhizobium sp. M0195 TaxID=2956910 RepID=UPI003338E232